MVDTPHAPLDRPGSRRRTARRVLLAAGLVLAAVILAIVAVYAVAFILLAPMMQ